MDNGHSKVLSLGILLLCYTVGYSLGFSKKLYSGIAITKQLNSPSKEVLSNVSAVMPIRLVVKRGARQVYVYRGKQILKNFRIAVGQTGWETPVGSYQVIYMKKDPIFKNFKTGEIINPGINNPLGKRLIVFKRGEKFNLAFHGTNQDKFIGQAVSHGCIRMHDKDVIALYELVNIGTSITVLP